MSALYMEPCHTSESSSSLNESHQECCLAHIRRTHLPQSHGSPVTIRVVGILDHREIAIKAQNWCSFQAFASATPYTRWQSQLAHGILAIDCIDFTEQFFGVFVPEFHSDASRSVAMCTC